MRVPEEVRVCWLWCDTQTALLAAAPACSLPFLQDRVCCVCREDSGTCTKTHEEQLQKRGGGMGNHRGKDNGSGKKIKGLETPEREMTSCCCHCCCPHCLWVARLGAVEPWLSAVAQPHHSTRGTNTFSLSGYLLWLWGVFLKQLCYLFQSQQNPLSHLNLQSRN